MEDNAIPGDIGGVITVEGVPIEDVSGIESDATDSGDATNLVDRPAGGAREALQLLGQALNSAVENLPDDEDPDE